LAQSEDRVASKQEESGAELLPGWNLPGNRVRYLRTFSETDNCHHCHHCHRWHESGLAGCSERWLPTTHYWPRPVGPFCPPLSRVRRQFTWRP